ncbi:acyl-CoA dehydrogenase C-terminal domain-containing protein [Inmirania thermothiophila]|uniref:3-methylmercaptopropionyl-CoA dehydrogenase n=1 Tax=Inmirania thermothiophila TaxID=1750597 RepID=A0A3N1Y6G9_9GAMM|nr:acyl-CoA dehydrogenase C-terminal domain-containing protein [Inmirania thermothiophila]ROR34108.1 alkylation response protein AidB-like acyl-CoA dehydrogenase [Inmirania thermothiophila]
MPSYRPPLREMRFVYRELLDPARLQALPGYGELDPELVEAVIEEAGRFCAEVLAPLNRVGDEEGCRLEGGEVRTPTGFRDAYRRYVEGGWPGLGCEPEHGGQGLPETVHVLVEEMVCSANLAFGIYPGLARGAYNAILEHGDEAQKAVYLPRLADGSWGGTMCLTEPQCGTDLGLVRTRAEPVGDGSYRITGSKIFISAGEHDLTENIVHLVLARLPDAPPGTAGISLFIVPKFLPREDGTPGERNAVTCSAIEHKMGINGSATCVLDFDGAVGWLMGEPHKGMRAMFTMMNAARLAVGIQGLGLAEAAYQAAAAYARERLQGRAPGGPRHPDKPADPILVHPDVRRMLLTMRAWTEGCRALAGRVAQALDVARRDEDPARREAAHDYVSLMTPVVKAFFTDAGFECANLAVQVYGGHGYIREQGVEQLVRDARITQIYEGTNGIQALDLVGRKLPAHFGRLARRFFHPVAEYLEARRGDEALAEFTAPLAKAFGRLQRATAWIAEQGLRDPEQAAAAATPYLRLFGLTALAFEWARMAELGLAGADGAEGRFYRAKVETARFYMQHLLPQSGGLLASILAGKAAITGFDDEAF